MLLTESKLISPKNSNNYWTYHDPIESVEYIPAWRFFFFFQFHDFDVVKIFFFQSHDFDVDQFFY